MPGAGVAPATTPVVANGVVGVKLLAVIGTRPNLVKMAPVLHSLADGALEVSLLHTGQHYDRLMYGSFMEQLQMPDPDFVLNVGSGTHAEQTAAVMVGTEQVLMDQEFHGLLVAGDVNSTLGAALAAAKLDVPIIHLESGLRSGDWTMPEEINRVLTDRLSQLLLCHCDDAIVNLRGEGIAGEHVQLVGNTMIDSLFALHRAAPLAEVLAAHGVQSGEFALVTLHRPATVDKPDRLKAVVDVLSELAENVVVLFPVHPRTSRLLAEIDVDMPPGLRLIAPLEYQDFVCLEARARFVITDSGGVQEETSAFGVPCLTYRTSTERPVTLTQGTNVLVGTDPEALRQACERLLSSAQRVVPAPIALWDGAAGPRAAAAIEAFMTGERTRDRPASPNPREAAEAG